jgi:Protein of unknown function (DUF3025)
MKLVVSPGNLHAQLASLDWRAAWWNPWREVGQRVAQRVLAGRRVCDALNADHPQLQFVPQSALPEGAAYEQFIFEQQQVPTRENLHDFFNGLAWLVFPHTKRRLNTLQNAAIQADGIQTTRGALRDALTLFDENAALWQAPPELVEALRAKQWQRAFIDLRGQWHHAQPVLFGHALLEKLVSPYKSITAHVYIAQAATESIADMGLDWRIAQQLSAAALVPKPFIPLPVLGVPGWQTANEDPRYYDDAQVFRPATALLALGTKP